MAPRVPPDQSGGTLPVLIADEHGPIVGAYAISEYLSDIMSGQRRA